MKNLIFILFFIIISCNQKNNLNIDPDKVYNNLLNQNDNIILLDVRTKEEVLENNIKNSINLDFYSDDFNESILNLNKSNIYYVYCRSGRRSLNTVEIMRENGFIHSYNVEGGILRWVELNLPLK